MTQPGHAGALFVYATDQMVPGMTDEHLLAVHAALSTASYRLSRRGDAIRVLDCRYLASQQRLVCTFAAMTAVLVHQAIELAQLPVPAVCELVGIAPD